MCVATPSSQNWHGLISTNPPTIKWAETATTGVVTFRKISESSSPHQSSPKRGASPYGCYRGSTSILRLLEPPCMSLWTSSGFSREARLAQSVEHETLRVEGSSPSSGDLSFFTSASYPAKINCYFQTRQAGVLCVRLVRRHPVRGCLM